MPQMRAKVTWLSNQDKVLARQAVEMDSDN